MTTGLQQLVLFGGSWDSIDSVARGGGHVREKHSFNANVTGPGRLLIKRETAVISGLPEEGFRNTISYTQQGGTPDFVFEVNFPNAFVGYRGSWASLDVTLLSAGSDAFLREEGWQWTVDVSALFDKTVQSLAQSFGVRRNHAEGFSIFLGKLTGGQKVVITLLSSIDDSILQDGAEFLYRVFVRAIVHRNRFDAFEGPDPDLELRCVSDHSDHVENSGDDG